MERINTCPVCNSNQQQAFITCQDHLVSKEQFNIVSCVDCGFKFTNPRPEENELNRYYQSEEYISHSDTKKGLVAKLYFLVRSRSIKKKANLLTQYVSRGTLLDYGCGTGYFLKHSKSVGWDVCGVESDPGAREVANSNGPHVFADKNDFISKSQNQQFDAITLWHVLEHLTDLNESLDFFHERLKQKGVLVIAVPNYLSHDAKVYGKNWAAYDVPRHLYHFDKSSIKHLLSNRGFELIRIKPMLFDSYYVSMLSEKHKTGKINYLRAFLNGLMSNLKGITNTNYSSHIYIFRKKI